MYNKVSYGVHRAQQAIYVTIPVNISNCFLLETIIYENTLETQYTSTHFQYSTPPINQKLALGAYTYQHIWTCVRRDSRVYRNTCSRRHHSYTHGRRGAALLRTRQCLKHNSGMGWRGCCLAGGE